MPSPGQPARLTSAIKVIRSLACSSLMAIPAASNQGASIITQFIKKPEQVIQKGEIRLDTYQKAKYHKEQRQCDAGTWPLLATSNSIHLVPACWGLKVIPPLTTLTPKELPRERGKAN